MQTTIYLIRHGEVDNPSNIIYGRLPHFGLTEKGRQEVKQTAAFLEDKKINAIYASPLLRAQQSAEIIKKHLGLPTVLTSEAITEVRTTYQGKKFSDLDLLQSEIYLKPLSPTDETLEQLADRMITFTHKLIKNNPGKHIVVVSHGDPIMALKTIIKKKTLAFLSFKTDHYVKHAEVQQLSDEGEQLSINSVFIPIV